MKEFSKEETSLLLNKTFKISLKRGLVREMYREYGSVDLQA